MLVNRFQEIKECFSNKLNLLSKTDDDVKSIVILTMIDSLAQNYKGYPERNFKDAFFDFIIDFTSEKWGFWRMVDPVSLYYRLKLSNIQLNDIPVLRCVHEVHVHHPNDEGFQENADELLNLIEDERERCKKESEHQYIALLYRLRSKLIHEGNKPYLLFSRTAIESYGKLPFYYSIGGGLGKIPYSEEIAALHTRWHLVFPPEFLELVFKECLENYLLYCERKMLDPFYSNDCSRTFYLTWYDKS